MSLPFMGDLHFYGERPPVARPTGVLRVIGVGATATVRLVIRLVTACHRLAVSVVSATRRHYLYFLPMCTERYERKKPMPTDIFP